MRIAVIIGVVGQKGEAPSVGSWPLPLSMTGWRVEPAVGIEPTIRTHFMRPTPSVGFEPILCMQTPSVGFEPTLWPYVFLDLSRKKSDTFSIFACHPCAGAMLIFSVSFQFLRMMPKHSIQQEHTGSKSGRGGTRAVLWLN